MSRLYFADEIYLEQEIDLPEDLVRHIQVLRLRVGDELVLFNGDGAAYGAQLVFLGKRQARCVVKFRQPESRESPLNIKLVQAISSGDRMDFTIQKSVELGVNVIQPISSERSVVKLHGERAEKRVQRWQEIVVSACEQCGRNTIPTVLPIVSLAQYLQAKTAEWHIFMSLQNTRSLKDCPPPPQNSLTLMIGAEGGWTEQEESMAVAAGCQAIRLGHRVLRTETASLAALAAIQTLWGDFV